MTDAFQNIHPRWVDAHCHLDLYPDHVELIAECDRERVATIAVTTTPKAWARNHELAKRSTYVRAALGLHPQLVAERAGELALFERQLGQARYVGEIGLDAGPRYYRNVDDQQRVFERILSACAEQGGKVLTIHSVRSVGRVLDCLERLMPRGRCKVIMHWFTGTAAEARRAVTLGCFFSINVAMLRSDRLETLLRELPEDRLLTETDGPFVLKDRTPPRPIDVADVVSGLAKLRGLTKEQLAKKIVVNLSSLSGARS